MWGGVSRGYTNIIIIGFYFYFFSFYYHATAGVCACGLRAAAAPLGLHHKTLFHLFKACMWESIILVLPFPTATACIARTIVILLHV